jgi:hypothetical protein
MSGGSAMLRYSLAALLAVIVIALGVRLAGEVGALDAARGDLADVQRNAEALRVSAASQALGPPLLDAKVSPPEKQLQQLLAGLGVTVRAARVTAVSAAGPSLVVARMVAEGQADAAALDRTALWAQANPRSVILDGLSASAAADGHGDVRIELDVLVRGMAAPAP